MILGVNVKEMGVLYDYLYDMFRGLYDMSRGLCDMSNVFAG